MYNITITISYLFSPMVNSTSEKDLVTLLLIASAVVVSGKFFFVFGVMTVDNCLLCIFLAFLCPTLIVYDFVDVGLSLAPSLNLIEV